MEDDIYPCHHNTIIGTVKFADNKQKFNTVEKLYVTSNKTLKSELVMVQPGSQCWYFLV